MACPLCPRTCRSPARCTRRIPWRDAIEQSHDGLTIDPAPYSYRSAKRPHRSVPRLRASASCEYRAFLCEVRERRPRIPPGGDVLRRLNSAVAQRRRRIGPCTTAFAPERASERWPCSRSLGTDPGVCGLISDAPARSGAAVRRLIARSWVEPAATTPCLSLEDHCDQNAWDSSSSYFLYGDESSYRVFRVHRIAVPS